MLHTERFRSIQHKLPIRIRGFWNGDYPLNENSAYGVQAIGRCEYQRGDAQVVNQQVEHRVDHLAGHIESDGIFGDQLAVGDGGHALGDGEGGLRVGGAGME